MGQAIDYIGIIIPQKTFVKLQKYLFSHIKFSLSFLGIN